jgi:pimeloyl-ACP methyl ester carboxylesterase
MKRFRKAILLTALAYVFFSLSGKGDYNSFQNIGSISYGSDNLTGKYYNVRGFSMYTEIYGAGQPLILIHGNRGSIKDFENQIPYFSKKFKVIVADSRGHGKSLDNNDSLSYKMMADDYAELLTQMKIDSAYVIGWSDGGIIGLMLSIFYPEKVQKLAFTGANLWPDTSAVFEDIIQITLSEYSELKHTQNKTVQQRRDWKTIRLLVEEPHIKTTDLKKISIPVLVIGGDHDVIRPQHTMLIADNIPKSYLWILPNSGHAIPHIYKNEFNKKIDHFFEEPFREIMKSSRFF